MRRITLYQPFVLTFFAIFYFSFGRNKLENATVESPLLAATGFKPSPSKGGNRVIETMSEHVDISIIDAVADEIAELVSNHTFNFRMEDTFNSTVVSFKPVVGTISSSN